jgi:hypothetical protein
MIASELAKILGTCVGLESRLGKGWQFTVEAWIDATYREATAQMNCPPAKPLAAARAAELSRQVLAKFGLQSCQAKVNHTAHSGRKHMPSVRPGHPARVPCSHCGKAFSERLGKCPVCFPSSTQGKAKEEKALGDAKQEMWRKLPCATIQNVPWSDALEMMHCHGGSGGVFLLKFCSGAVCVKAECCSPASLFAQKFAKALSIPTPSMRGVLDGSPENSLIREALRSAEPTFEDHRLQVKGSSEFTVMEFVDGCSMMGMPAHVYLSEHRAHPSPNHPNLWYDLGKLMGFDMLINNFDRLPLAWSNEGNLGNVMLGSRVNIIVGVDQSVQPITHPEGLRNYQDRVRAACKEAPDGVGKSFMKVQEAIYNNTAIELTPAEVNDLRRGCLDLLSLVVRHVSLGDMDEILESVSKAVVEELADWDASHGASACCHLIRNVVHAVHDSLGTPQPNSEQ